jgi:hypothetical protein
MQATMQMRANFAERKLMSLPNICPQAIFVSLKTMDFWRYIPPTAIPLSSRHIELTTARVQPRKRSQKARV